MKNDGGPTPLTRRDLVKGMVAALSLPALPLSAANALAYHKAPILGCGEEFPWFGAHYPDARCIDGFLWDLDSYEDGFLTSGGDYACPYCNARTFLERVKYEIEEKGWVAFTDGEAPLDNPYLRGSRFPHLTHQLQKFWTEGYRSAAIDPEAIEDRSEAKAMLAARASDKQGSGE